MLIWSTKYFLINSCEPQLCWHFIGKHCLKILFSFPATRFIVRTAYKHTPANRKNFGMLISVCTHPKRQVGKGNNLWICFTSKCYMYKAEGFGMCYQNVKHCTFAWSHLLQIRKFPVYEFSSHSQWNKWMNEKYYKVDLIALYWFSMVESKLHTSSWKVI